MTSVRRRIAIISCRRDIPRLNLLLGSLEATGNDIRDVLLVMTDRESEETLGLGVGEIVALDCPQGHPQAVNAAFEWLLEDSHRNKYDFLFLEPDCTALAPGILKILGDDCEFKNSDILTLCTFHHKRGWYQSGVGYYRHTCGAKLINRMRERPENAPFDFWIVPVIWPSMVAPTNRFGDTEPPAGFSDLDWVDSQWFIHHGDKTGEAARLVIERCQSKNRSPSRSRLTGWIPRWMRRSSRRQR